MGNSNSDEAGGGSKTPEQAKFEEGMKNLGKLFDALGSIKVEIKRKKTPMEHAQEWAPYVLVGLLIAFLLYKLYKDKFRTTSFAAHGVSRAVKSPSPTSTNANAETSSQGAELSLNERMELARMRQQAALEQKAREAAEARERKLAEERLKFEQQQQRIQGNGSAQDLAETGQANAKPKPKAAAASSCSATAPPSRRTGGGGGGGFNHFGGSGGSNFKPTGFARPRGGG